MQGHRYTDMHVCVCVCVGGEGGGKVEVNR